MVVLDWKDGKIVGLEVLDAAALLHPDLLAQAVRSGQVYSTFAFLGCDCPVPGTSPRCHSIRPSCLARAIMVAGIAGWAAAQM